MTTTTTLYDVRRRDGTLSHRGCTAIEAFEALLAGGYWRIIREPQYPAFWSLQTSLPEKERWRSPFFELRNNGEWRPVFGHGTALIVIAADESEATAKFAQIILRAHPFPWPDRFIKPWPTQSERITS